ncbi:DUF2948 family protein [Zavarzinia compransoris]|uniref:DUF2948 domain-containing protein n=1 Tax=Zavarzinia compransoris TaxID=1264899 RepID=A0A317DVX1_9PROT|nr:DUF2948 family protein [Zavarzinia compransoris]PWR18681.1 DUF2948 domain-containing protein [Zavarzinia compransoris]TDP48655.1 DUF2948 family protein [Zavarzinia compransoris]
MSGEPLNLGFADADDLGIVSALVQDAVVKTADLVYLGRMKRFALVANRFCWEAEGKAFRRRCGLHFDTVRTVRAKGIDRTAVEQVLELLAVDAREHENGVTIDLVFAGDAHLRLEAEAVEGGLKDLSEPWPTKRAPRHDVDGESA